MTAIRYSDSATTDLLAAIKAIWQYFSEIGLLFFTLIKKVRILCFGIYDHRYPTFQHLYCFRNKIGVVFHERCRGEVHSKQIQAQVNLFCLFNQPAL
jgi:hypothetical protein